MEKTTEAISQSNEMMNLEATIYHHYAPHLENKETETEEKPGN